MSGLLNSQNTQAAPENPAMQGQGGAGQEAQATPEEQAIFEKYVAASIGEILNNPTTFQKLMKAIEASKASPVEGLARIALSMYEKAESKLGPLEDDDISEAVGETIIEELLDLAVEAKLLTEQQVNEDIAAAIYTKLAQSWIEQHPERASPEDLSYIEQQKATGGQA